MGVVTIFILLDKVFLILKNSNDAKVNFWLHEIVKKINKK